MKKLKKSDVVLVQGRRWFDKVNGNTYHSATVYVNNEEVAREPFQYGYGDSYQYTGLELINKTYGTNFDGFRSYEGYNIAFTVSDGLKREL